MCGKFHTPLWLVQFGHLFLCLKPYLRGVKMCIWVLLLIKYEKQFDKQKYSWHIFLCTLNEATLMPRYYILHIKELQTLFHYLKRTSFISRMFCTDNVLSWVWLVILTFHLDIRNSETCFFCSFSNLLAFWSEISLKQFFSAIRHFFWLVPSTVFTMK